MGRGPTSREVVLAWRVAIDEPAWTRARKLPLLETATDRTAFRAFTPRDMRAFAPEAFTVDAFEDDVWTFLCLLHDDDWANADGDLLAGRLAKLATGGRGVVVAALGGRVADAWRIASGAAHAVTPAPPLAFAPAPDAAATSAALDAVEAAVASDGRVKKRAPGEALPGLVAAHLPGLVPTEDPLRYAFAAHPGVVLTFPVEKRQVVPVLRRVGEVGGRRLEVAAADLEGTIAALGGSAYNGLGVQLPLFLAEEGEPVAPAALVAALRVVRWEVARIARSRRARPEVIAACVDFLLGGVWDETARANLVLFVGHPSCPDDVVERLAGHTSKSIRDACAARRAAR